MRVLWITNLLFPEASSIISGSKDLKSSGGWLLGAADGLLKDDSVELFVATVSPLVKVLTRIKGKRIQYYLIPYGKGNLVENNEYNPFWQQIKSEVEPDIIHIHGTEYTHGYAYVQACGSKNVVVSIQGLKSACSFYYSYGISNSDILFNLTLKDLIRGTIWKQKRKFKKSGEVEDKLLRSVHHVIGRTAWDHAQVWTINSNASYYTCNETLREEFYDGSIWSYDLCQKNEIFLSQASYPLKGLHQVIKALPIIHKHCPGVKLRIAGPDIIQNRGVRDCISRSGYARYLRRLIRNLHLEDSIKFLGNLNAEEMKREYLRCNLFICPSSLENSPNSLGEAQILGTPCIASFVGGVPDMMQNSNEGLYRFEDIEMLAYKVCQMLKSQDSPNLQLIDVAKNRHHPEINSKQLKSIYNIILKDESIK